MSKELLNDLYAFLGRFIVYPSKEAQVAHTLWIIHTHLMGEWYISPRLAFLSPTKSTGKTRAMQITELLVPNAVLTISASAPYIYRRLADPNRSLPTILYDEIDTVFGFRSKKDTEELRAILNAGYKRGATVGRCVGDKYETEEFPVYCAVALAGIDRLANFETIRSRSIIVEMQRRKAGETVEQYRSRDIDPEGHLLRDRISEWTQTLRGIGDDRPDMPKSIVDRDAELWEPLLAIADRAGEDWPDRARVAAVALVAPVGKEDRGDTGERLLSDIRTLFEEKDKDRLHTSYIINILINIKEAPWNIINRGNPIDDRLLANILRPFGVSSEDIRIDSIVRKGYYKHSFRDAWERYLPPLPSQEGQQAQQGQHTYPVSPQALQGQQGKHPAAPVSSPARETRETEVTDDLSSMSFEEYRRYIESRKPNPANDNVVESIDDGSTAGHGRHKLKIMF